MSRVEPDPSRRRFIARQHPLLGTVVEIVVTDRPSANGVARARVATAAVTAEIERLERVFSAYRADSELSLWKRGELGEPNVELCEVMEAALDWQIRSRGSFNPLAGELSACWRSAEADGRVPSITELANLTAAIAEPRFEIRHGVPHRRGDCTHLDLNAIAKGYIVDRAVELAWRRYAPLEILVSAGGDLAHRGDRPARVAIENPLRPYDNEPPIAFTEVRDSGLATSGGSRRGFRVGGRRYSHVIDARSGLPVEAQASITVVAPSAMEADALTTVAGVMEPPDASSFLDGIDGVSGLVVDPTGRQWTSSRWTSSSWAAPSLVTSEHLPSTSP